MVSVKSNLPLDNYSVVEEKERYTLVFSLAAADKIGSVQSKFNTLTKRSMTPLSVFEVKHFTPAVQRRLGWGDVRSLDGFKADLYAELEVKGEDTFSEERRELAAVELLLRYPQLTEKDLRQKSDEAVVASPSAASAAPALDVMMPYHALAQHSSLADGLSLL